MEDESQDKKLSGMVDKASKTVDGAKTAVDSANNLMSTIKWVCIAFVVLAFTVAAYTAYKIVSKPVAAVSDAVGGMSDAVKSGSVAVKDNTSDLINRLSIQITDQDQLDTLSDSAFASLTDMDPTAPSGMKDRLFRKANFGGSQNRICALSVDFGNGEIPVLIAADNDAFETSKALGSKNDRLIRVVIRTKDDVSLNTAWDAEAQRWIVKWKATTVKKPVSDAIAEQRAVDVLNAAKTGC